MPETEGYRELRSGLAAIDPRREVVRAAGPDAGAFLQGQLSQDVAALAAGASAWSWLLQPAGKVEALVRVTHLEGDIWLIDTDAGWGQAVAVRLARFKLRTKVDLEVMGGWRVVGLRGPDAPAPGTPAPGAVAAVDASWPGLPGVDLIGPDPVAPDAAVAAGAAAWEAARIEAGVPVMGAELTEKTIPAETGLVGQTVSFTKGCYTGQELVARIDSRGSNVPRLLRGVRLEGPAAPGWPLRLPDGADAGVVTSAAYSPASGWVALAYVRRGVQPGAAVTAAGAPDAGGAAVAGTVATLPMVEGERPAP